MIPSSIGTMDVVKELPVLQRIGSIHVDVRKGVIGGDTVVVGQLFAQKHFKGLDSLEAEQPQLLVKAVEFPDQINGRARPEMVGRTVTEGICVTAEPIVVYGVKNLFDFDRVATEAA